MVFVYGIGEPGDLEFHLAQDQKAIPEQGTTYAVCKGNRRDDYLDEYTFHAMTDGEYYELQAAINQAKRCEVQSLERNRHFGWLQRVRVWLNSRFPRREIM